MKQQSDKMKVFQVFTIPLSLTFLRGQVKYMREHDVEIECVVSPSKTTSSLFSKDEPCTIHNVQMTRSITPFADLISLFSLIKLFIQSHPDIVHGNTPKAGLLSMVAAWVTRVPARIYQIRGLRHSTMRGWRRYLLKNMEKVSCRLACRVICNSHSLFNEVIRENICSSEKMKILSKGSGNGVDAVNRFNTEHLSGDRNIRHELKISEDAFVIGYVGRLTKDKGIEDLYKAWSGIRSEVIDAYMMLVGDFEDGDPPDKNITEALKSDKRVFISGWTDEVAPYYAAMDILVFPSHREGFPNAPLEAAAMELPVITTDATGCVDSVTDGVTGRIVRIADTEGLKKAIKSYIVHEEERVKHGAAGRQRVLKCFQPEGIWKELLQEYRDVTE